MDWSELGQIKSGFAQAWTNQICICRSSDTSNLDLSEIKLGFFRARTYQICICPSSDQSSLDLSELGQVKFLKKYKYANFCLKSKNSPIRMITLPIFAKKAQE